MAGVGAPGAKISAMKHPLVLPPLVTPTVTSPDLNLSLYPVKDDAGHLSLTIINKEHGDGARSATVSIDETHAYSGRGHLMQLAAPAQDPAATPEAVPERVVVAVELVCRRTGAMEVSTPLRVKADKKMVLLASE